MSKKSQSIAFKETCDCLYRHPNMPCSNANVKSVNKLSNSSRNMVTSKKTASSSCHDSKIFSDAVISNYRRPPIVKPKKTTKSDACLPKKVALKIDNMDFCKRSGDSNRDSIARIESSSKHSKTSENKNIKASIHRVPSKSLTNKEFCKRTSFESMPNHTSIDQSCLAQEYIKKDKSTIKNKIKSSDLNTIQSIMYYKNEHFKPTSDSAHEIDNAVKKKSIFLDTIKELPELQNSKESMKDCNNFNVYYDSGDTVRDADSYDSIRKLKEFRQNNYFECHSSKSRLDSKSSLIDHKCVYRFYLNDRLFPVPLNTDHRKKIRCVECHLPFEDKNANRNKNCGDNINGTIQAKVKIGAGELTQDILLILPVKEPLIITEKRLENTKDEDVVYFGVVRLSSCGNSMFNQNVPADSLALKYQKGFKEFKNERYEYQRIDDGEIIRI